MQDIRKVLTIAGSDSSGGAGIQADLKTMLAHGVYGMSALTAMTAQNTQGVYAVQEASPAFLAAELDAVFTDIMPDAVKIGMVASAPLIEVIAKKLAEYGARHIVVDPVMVATSGARLIEQEATAALKDRLFPLAELLTPNLAELAALTGREIADEASMQEAAEALYRSSGANVLAKGGHLSEQANDLLVTAEGSCWIYGERIENPNTHGTGCTLSSAIASNLAKDYSLEASVRRAKAYLTGAILAGLDLGKGRGPLDHGHALTGMFF